MEIQYYVEMTDYIPNPANYTMKGNLPKPAEIAQNAPDLSRLEEMTREEWGALADIKLKELLHTATGPLLLAVIRESKDRLEGKPMQREMRAIAVVQPDVKITFVD